MNIRPLRHNLFLKFRLAAALFLALAALPMLWTGMDLPLPHILPSDALAGNALAGTSLADDAGDNGRNAALALVPEQRLLLLQSGVDTLALGFGAVVAENNFSEAEADRLLADALNSLTFSLGRDLYFTAWQGTRIVHAPLNDDAAGLDFADSLDGRGAPFVSAMRALAGEEGGFLRVLLPPQRRPAQAAHARLPVTLEDDGIGHSPAAFCAFDSGCSLPGHDAPAPGAPASAPDKAKTEADIEQVLYVRGIPGSDRYIAAFLPARPAPLPQGGPEAGAVFSSVWENDDGDLTAWKQERFSRGLRLSGLSLAGLAGLMLLPAASARRGNEEQQDGEEHGA